MREDSNGLTIYRCLRGTSTLEEFHQKLMLKVQSWNASPEHVNDVLYNFRHRYNVRASERNRKNFPQLGHFDHHLIDYIQSIGRTIYGENIYSWWGQFQGQEVIEESFGVIPCVSPAEYEDITDADLNDHDRPMKFMARAMKTVIPHIPVQTTAEMAFYARSVMSYFQDQSLKVDFDTMATDWNSNRLKLYGVKPEDDNFELNPNSVRKKLPEHLRSYHTVYIRAIERKNHVNMESETIDQVRDIIARSATAGNEFLEAVDPQPLVPEEDIDLNSDTNLDSDHDQAWELGWNWEVMGDEVSNSDLTDQPMRDVPDVEDERRLHDYYLGQIMNIVNDIPPAPQIIESDILPPDSDATIVPDENQQPDVHPFVPLHFGVGQAELVEIQRAPDRAKKPDKRANPVCKICNIKLWEQNEDGEDVRGCSGGVKRKYCRQYVPPQ
jgi:hypothetical protein